MSSERYQRNDRTRVKYNFPAGSDIGGIVRNIESTIINDNTYISELANSFSNSTGTFQSLVTDSITGDSAFFTTMTGGLTFADELAVSGTAEIFAIWANEIICFDRIFLIN